MPVAFHVDYWNGLGWRDKLSSGEFSGRQRHYASDWSAEDVYTPEFVLNGPGVAQMGRRSRDSVVASHDNRNAAAAPLRKTLAREFLPLSAEWRITK